MNRAAFHLRINMNSFFSKSRSFFVRRVLLQPERKRLPIARRAPVKSDVPSTLSSKGAAPSWFSGLFVAVALAIGISSAKAADSSAGAVVASRIREIQGLFDEGKFADAEAAAHKLSQDAAKMALLEPDQIKVLRVTARAEYEMGSYKECRMLNERALELARKNFGPASQEFATIEDDLAAALRRLGNPGAAGKFLDAYQTFSSLKNPDQQLFSDVLVNYGIQLYYSGEFDKAAELTKLAIEKRRAYRPANEPSIAQALDNYGTILIAQGRLTAADAALKEALDIRKRVLPSNHPDVASSLNDLGVLLQRQGDYTAALDLLTQAMSIDKKTYGNGRPEVLTDLNNIGEVRRLMGQPDVALSIENEVLAGREAANKDQEGDESANYDLATSNANIANLLGDMGRYHDAEKYYIKALSLDRKLSGGKPTPDIAADLNNIAENYRSEERWDDAAAAYKEGLEAAVAAGEPARLMHATLLQDLGVLDLQIGKLPDAVYNLKLASELKSDVLAEDHVDIATARAWYALALAAVGNSDAMSQARFALELLKRRNVKGHLGASPAAVAAEARSERKASENILRVLAAAGGQDLLLDPRAADDALAALQIANSSGTSVVVSRVASALLAGDQAMSKLLRRIQDLRDQRDVELAQEAQAAADKHSASAASVSDIDLQLAEALAKVPTEVSALADADDELTFAGIRPLLSEHEAWLGFVVGQDRTFAVIVTREGVRIHVAEIGKKELQALVSPMVDQLNVESKKPFDLAASHRLYATLFGETGQSLAGLAKLTIVLDGPLESLPPAVLVTSVPPNAQNSVSGYMEASWLSDNAVLTLVPSLSVAKSLAHSADMAKPSKAFIGFGNPALGPSTFRLYQGSAEAVTNVMRLPSIKITGVQLDVMNDLFAHGKGELYEGKAATKQAVLDAPLQDFRVVAFATHGLLPTESLAAEPALVMTPADKTDDGLLTATQIAQLQMNADLVILSACNTAAPRKDYAADGLSGLARSFFHAGARAVMISHWPVDALAAHDLLRLMASARGKPIAVAFNSALRSLRQEPNFAHPAFWASFDLVGRGDVPVIAN